jgi:GABA permease
MLRYLVVADQTSERLDRVLAWFRELGLEVDGEVGDGHPLLAIWDALGDGGFDQIIFATLPAGLSRWLGTDLPARVRAAFDLPVTHIVPEAEPRRARR